MQYFGASDGDTGLILASSRASRTSRMMWVLWCAAVSFGRNPVPDAHDDTFVQPTGGAGG